MTADKLSELVNNSELSQLQKNLMLGFIANAMEAKNKNSIDRKLIEEKAGINNISEVLLSNDDVKIYKVTGKEEWEVKYPYRSIYCDKKGVWRSTNMVSPSFDVAFIVYLEAKYLDSNSKFSDFALKMLEIKIEE